MSITIDKILSTPLLHTHKALDINISDTGDYYTGTEVETALQEVGGKNNSNFRYLFMMGR